ncbi:MULTISPECIES: 2-methylaconitate cis-trans isomerase PrpF [Vibrio]|uniref:2-methylaconitate cis-trans isomerase PrpF n=1 Tax=Vibrio TaxID=662 RepID=UPI000B5C97E7|nr:MULTISPECIES: 2-methylaconitate cis-trans isomerase PrpF [Vibrio]HBV75575.1 2-methylaconitate cis-trans isomerase PrpF [Vibrio sp.]
MNQSVTVSQISGAQQIKVPATYMRAGTSKGVFFNLADLPTSVQKVGESRDQFLLRVIGSPDPYGKQIDGMGGATSSTSKVVILSKSDSSDHDVDYLFGQVSIDSPFVDWSGNCGNLSSGVGAMALHMGLIDGSNIPQQGLFPVRIRQVNINKTIVTHVPIKHGQVQELGGFELDGVTFPAAEIQVDFLDPSDSEPADGEAADGKGSMFPTGNVVDELEVPGVGCFQTTFINSGIPTMFIDAQALGYQGTELQDDINNDVKALAMFETIRAHGAVKMGLIEHVDQAKQRQHTPKIAFVSPPKSYTTSSGQSIQSDQVDVLVRALSMGKLHHAMMGTAAVAIASAASVPGTIVNRAAGGGERESVVFGHPSGTLKVGAKATYYLLENGEQGWKIEKATMSRSARILMEGWVRVPQPL